MTEPEGQLLLPLPHRLAYGREDFLIGAPNQAAIDKIERVSDWPSPILVVVGPPGSGKTHLAHVFLALHDGKMIDGYGVDRDTVRSAGDGPALVIDNLVGDAELEDPDALFLLVDGALRYERPTLVTSRAPVAALDFVRDDTRSRLMMCPVVRLLPPDDVLLSGVMVKLFADRQLHVTPEIIRYLAQRADRSFSFVNRMVAAIDDRAVALGRRVTLKLVREVLSKLQPASDDEKT